MVLEIKRGKMLTEQDCRDVLQLAAEHKTITEAAKAAGMLRSTFEGRLQTAKQTN